MPEPKAHPRRRLFYGWVIVGVMAAVSALSMALGTLNFGLFVRPMGDELGIGRAIFGWTQTARLAVSGVLSPLVGVLIDRFGSRVLLAVAAGVTGTAMVGLSQVSHAWQLVALYAVMGLVAMGGPGTMVTTVPVAKWFVRYRGRAMALVSIGFPVGGVVFLPLTQTFIDNYGWRSAWVLLAGIGVGAIIPLSLLFVRRHPEDMGLAPDGAPPTRASSSLPISQGQRADVAGSSTETSWSLPEAMRTPTFWRLVFVFSAVQLAMASLGLHRIPNFIDRGLDAGLVSYATALDAVASGVSSLVVGLLVERFPVRLLGGMAFAVLSVAILLTIMASNHVLLFLSTGTFGIGVGGFRLLQDYLWADYFGRRHLGSIRGAVMPIILVFGGIGAPLAGYIRDSVGSYNSIWSVGVVVVAVAALVLVLTPRPTRKPAA